MSDLVVVAYEDEHRAAEVLATLRRLQSEYLIDLEDAAVVTKNAESKVKLQQSQNLTAAGALGGGFWGLLIGTLFFVPVVGAAVGAGAGALAGKFSDTGVDDRFVKDVSNRLGPSTSALFVLVQKATPERVVPEIARFGGTVLRTSLAPEAEARLQEALSASATSS